jgi:cyclophilin family peptidyl-prolyl cis-trans isomerase
MKSINWGTIFWAFLIALLVLLIVVVAPNSNNTNNTNKIMTGKTATVTLETTSGNIEIALDLEKAPITVENFLKLARAGFYDKTKFHRVIKGFMIQGGDPYTKGEDTSVYGTGGPGYQFADEKNDLEMVRGVIAMANSGPNTNGSQFFIVTTQSAPWLVGKHTVFGKVISGMEIVDKIENVITTGSPYDRPVTPVVVEKVTVK